jgi:hypothetical protein
MGAAGPRKVPSSFLSFFLGGGRGGEVPPLGTFYRMIHEFMIHDSGMINSGPGSGSQIQVILDQDPDPNLKLGQVNNRQIFGMRNNPAARFFTAF